MEEFIGSNIPPYAILSHTWEEGEVSLQDMKNHSVARRKKGFTKVKMTCHQAVEDGLEFAWVDTCCIDKSSSAELSEAINSMFRWYQRAAICYVYLSDLRDVYDITGLGKCRWFTRGWTLQELIAPPMLEFFDYQWNYRGYKSKETRRGNSPRSLYLGSLVSKITGIDLDILEDASLLSSVAVAKKMSWAANRQTTRVEDAAYCLLGLFDVNMPLLYGEEGKAFTRLQQEILRTTDDLTIFAWASISPSGDSRVQDTSVYRGVLAESPAEFYRCRGIEKYEIPVETDISITNKGIRTESIVHYIREYNPREESQSQGTYILPLWCHYSWEEDIQHAIYLRKIGGDTYARARPTEICRRPFKGNDPTYLLETTAMNMLTKMPRLTGKFDLAAANRGWALQIRIPGDLDYLGVYPNSHWDAQDKLFFTSRNPMHPGWCIARIGLPEEIIFVCFGWAREDRAIEYGMFRYEHDLHAAGHYKFLLDVMTRKHNDVGWVSSDLNHLGVELKKKLELDLGTKDDPVPVTFSVAVDKHKNDAICSGVLYQAVFSFTGQDGKSITS
jgi:hypothetical protein